MKIEDGDYIRLEALALFKAATRWRRTDMCSIFARSITSDLKSLEEERDEFITQLVTNYARATVIAEGSLSNSKLLVELNRLVKFSHDEFLISKFYF